MTVGAAALVLLVACGGSGEGSAADKPKQTNGQVAAEKDDTVPPCTKVWVADQKLPEGYEGCMNGDSLEVLVTHDCEDGRRLASYDDKYWAFLGDTISFAASGTSGDPAYAKAFDC